MSRRRDVATRSGSASRVVLALRFSPDAIPVVASWRSDAALAAPLGEIERLRKSKCSMNSYSSNQATKSRRRTERCNGRRKRVPVREPERGEAARAQAAWCAVGKPRQLEE